MALGAFRMIAAGAVLALSGSAALAEDLLIHEPSTPAFIDEIRLGTSASIQTGDLYEPGLFPWMTIYFDPFDRRSAETVMDELARPRIHAGAIVSTTGHANQVYSGFTWSFDLTDSAFVELGLGGTLTDADLNSDAPGVQVGCSLLFHEQLAAGIKLDDNWRLVAQVEHSSNANLCSPNDGLTYAGIGLGYKF